MFSLAERKKLAAEQAALQKAATEAAKVVREMRRSARGRRCGGEAGMKVNEIDTRTLVQASLKAQDELAKEFGAEKLLDQIQKTSVEKGVRVGRPRRRIRHRGDLAAMCAVGLLQVFNRFVLNRSLIVERGIPDLLPRLDRVPRRSRSPTGTARTCR